MGIMPRRKLPPGTKIRWTLYPKKIVKPEKPEAPETPEPPKAKPGGEWRWVPTREKPESLKATGKMPWFGERQPKYEQPAETPPAAEVPAAPVKKGKSWSEMSAWEQAFVLLGFALLAGLLGGLIIRSINEDGGGGGGSGVRRECQIDCGSGGGTVAPYCNCPPACPRYFIITNPPSMKGWKECYR